MEFEGSKRPEESNPQWFRRVISEPFATFDTSMIQSMFDEIEEKRATFDKQLLEDINAASLELYAWATARPLAEHQKTFNTIEEKLQNAHETSGKQEEVREQLFRFASIIKEAFSLLLATRPTIPTSKVIAPNLDPEMETIE